MRGIGKGQTLVLFVPPEVRTLQQVEVALGRGVTREARAAALAALPHAGRARAELEDVASWLMLNAMRAEKVQFELWCSQCAHNVWRKRAMAVLASRHAEFGNHATVKGGSAVPEAHRAERRCLDVFRDRVEHDVSNTVPRRGNMREDIVRASQEHAAPNPIPDPDPNPDPDPSPNPAQGAHAAVRAHALAERAHAALRR